MAGCGSKKKTTETAAKTSKKTAPKAKKKK